jgi:hypothetical protein
MHDPDRSTLVSPSVARRVFLCALLAVASLALPVAARASEPLEFAPTIELLPEASATSTPTGLRLDLHIPQEETGGSADSANLRNAVLTLPEGMTVNPSFFTGTLAGCSVTQIGLEPVSGQEPSCPEASKIGEVEVSTPAVDHPLSGAVYLAAQEENPFHSLLAVYVVIDDPASNAIIKLPVHIELGEEGVLDSLKPGQLRVSFANSSQFPFEEIKLNFFGGPTALLVTPASCGAETTSSELTSWSSEAAATPSSEFEIDQGCGAPGFSPVWTAGLANSQAGAYTQYAMVFSRNDSEQDFKAVEVTFPPGLNGHVAGVPLCANAQANAGSCPSSSQIGAVAVAAGAGPDPVSLPGKIYLTGPYNGGPFGEVAEIPAMIGAPPTPFNLGTIAVRGSIRVNRLTGQESIVSDPFPSILDGVPLRSRSITMDIDRPGFLSNPTNCEGFAINATLTSAQGTSAAVSSPSKATNCQNLPFKPVVTVSTQSMTSKVDGTSLSVKITANPGEAGMRKFDAQLPLALPARLTTLNKACAEAQFNANPAGCPAASDVGMATVHTPLLSVPLTGPAYFVSHGGAAFPNLEIVLQGEGVTIDAVGNTDIKHGISSAKYETLPDAPFSAFEFYAPPGPYSILTANGNLCAPTKTVTVREHVTIRVHGHVKHVSKTVTRTVPEALVEPTTIVGQNGIEIKENTPISVTGCPKAKKATLTRAQKLAKALQACHNKSRAARAKCERQVRRRSPPSRRRTRKRSELKK